MSASSASSSSCVSETGSCEVFQETVKSTVPHFASRAELPTQAVAKNISIWAVLRHAIGKDLSRFSIPIVFNEPLSMLQRLAEYMEYYQLLDQACQTDDAVKRIELVTAFALSTLASSSVRLSKPFNPLLYETYELSKPELGFQFVAEQVSHHPPVSAFYAKGSDYEFYGAVEPRVKFWGRSIEVIPNAHMTLHLTSKNETYTWQAASCSIHNIVMGKMYMCLSGQMVIKCPETDLQSIMKFRGAGKNGPDVIAVGDIVKISNPKDCLRSIYGNWTEYLASTHWGTFQASKNIFESETRSVEKKKLQHERIVMFREARMLWRVYKKPPTNKDFYNLTYFAMTLNEPLADGSKLPKTDSRLRPDMRLLEAGDVDKATREKERLENKQRAKVKAKNGKELVEPVWFNVVKEQGRTCYQFNSKYFNREFTACEDIY